MTPTETCERITNSRRWHVWGPIVGALLSALIAGVVAPWMFRAYDATASEAAAMAEVQERIQSHDARLSDLEDSRDRRRERLSDQLDTLNMRLGEMNQRLSRIEGRLGERGG